MPGRLKAFVEELRRRRIGRVAIVYAVSAWVLIQVADVVFPRVGLPDTLVTLLIVIASVGFPIALTLAWFFDIVPDAASPSRRVPRWLAVGGVLVLVLVAAGAAARIWPRLVEGPAHVRSLAVLPFGNLSADADQAHIVDGMHDAVITELAQISAVRVLSRTSTLRYRDTVEPLGVVAAELGVDAIVEASVLRLGDRLRIQAQLIRPLPRERHVWAESYDRDVRDVLSVHSDIARSIAEVIRAPVTDDEAQRLAATRPVDPAAYEAYLRGMYFLQQQTPDGYERGLRYLHDAVELDPAAPHAYAGLALGYSLIGHGTIPDAFDRAKAAAHRALELDSTTAMAHEALAEIALYHDWDYDAAQRGFRRVLALNANLADAAAHYAWYLELRERSDDARQLMNRARQLDPLNPLWAAWAGWLSLNFDDAAALTFGRSALELNAHHPHALYVTARAAAQLGHRDEAMSLIRTIDAIPPYRWGAAHVHAILGNEADARRILVEIENAPTPMNAFGLGLTYAELGDTDDAVDWLDEARRLRFSWMPWIHRRSVLPASLFGDPRFETLLREMKLPSSTRPVAVAR